MFRDAEIQTRSAKSLDIDVTRKNKMMVLTMKSTMLRLAFISSTDFGATRMMVSGVVVSGSVKILEMALADIAGGGDDSGRNGGEDYAGGD